MPPAPRLASRLALFLAAGTAALVSIVVAVSVGAVPIPPLTVWRIALDHVAPGWVVPDWSVGRGNIVWDIRFPRVLLAGLVGAGLGMVGAALQAVTRNPLADPHLLGISSGAAFGAIAALMHTGLFLGLLTVPLMAFGGALAATGLVLAVARFAGSVSADRLVLVGVAVSFVIMACANILIFLGDPKATHTVVFWMLGGLGLAQWPHLLWPLAVLLACGAWLFLQAPRLNAMALGDETATTMGMNVERFRLAVFTVAALVTGVMLS